MKKESTSVVHTSSGEVCCVIMASKKSYMYCTKTITKIIQGQVHKEELVRAELVKITSCPTSTSVIIIVL